MLARILSASLFGIEARPVLVEVDLLKGLPGVQITGLPDAAIRESHLRIKAAIINSNFTFPRRKVAVNLAPADLRKEGSALDLPIALSVLAADGKICGEPLRRILALGELSLDGTLRPVRGALPAAVLARKTGKRLLLPAENACEAGRLAGIEICPVDNLARAASVLNGTAEPLILPRQEEAADSTDDFGRPSDEHLDFSDVRGQAHAKRAIEVAVAGGHNLLLIGPPGSGKTMMASRIPAILPPLSEEEALETTCVYSAAGHWIGRRGLISHRPFRSPHHTVTAIGLIGGGSVPAPGEASLSHNGVLFLDELPEFRREVLEVMRQPLESRIIHLTRSNRTARFPASFMLVAAMNPCPCGYLGDPDHECGCTPLQVQRYVTRISGPLLDRIDIQVEVPAVRPGDLSMTEVDMEPESKPTISDRMRERVMKARQRQNSRFQKAIGKRSIPGSNSQLSPNLLRRHCRLDPESQTMLCRAMEKLGLSARAHTRIRTLARTIADLEEADSISTVHLAEAIQYRVLERRLWLDRD